jgi:glyoxylase-like metal-dependent hydrolase (beta-lactamase superfamily II)/ferredoxin
MALVRNIHPANSEGSLFVDTSCIDCGTCYHLAPESFEEAEDENSFVKNQPQTPREWMLAKRALISCPTNSIGVKDAPAEFRDALVQLPFLIADNIYYCGYTSRDSYGASSYLIERSEGNILIDSPRFNSKLVNELELLGGLKYMILTHQDDVADHQKFADHFQCERVIHRDEVTSDTLDVENKLDLQDEFHFLPELKLIHTPGHTKGHIVVLYRNKFLFTGDHLFYDQSLKMLASSKNVCWFSWEEQIDSTRKLLQYQFEWLLPGHGGWGREAPERMHQQLKDLVDQMETR